LFKGNNGSFFICGDFIEEVLSGSIEDFCGLGNVAIDDVVGGREGLRNPKISNKKSKSAKEKKRDPGKKDVPYDRSATKRLPPVEECGDETIFVKTGTIFAVALHMICGKELQYVHDTLWRKKGQKIDE